MPWLYRVCCSLARILFLLLARWRVKGSENVPREGPLLIVANHISLVDGPLLGASLDRRLIFMAKKELFHSKLLGSFLRHLGSFPVYRGQLDREALRQALQVLANSSALVMFPEGTRSRRAQLQPALSGSALIALHSGVPILPVGIIGTEKMRNPLWILHRPEITVNIGRPFHLPPPKGRLTKEKLTEPTDSIMRHIAELLPPEYRGSYTEEEDKKHEN